MGLRFYKSVKICKGVRLNFSKSGIGLSLGVRGARYSIGANGRKRVSVGIPGTGIYYSKSISSHPSSAGGNQSHSGSAIKNPTVKNTTVHYDNNTSYTYTPADVSRYTELIRILTRIHETCSEAVDWEFLRDAEPPFVKGTVGPRQAAAQTEYDNIKPTFTEKLSKSKFEERKQMLREEISSGAQEDQDAYSAWEESRLCASKVLAGDIDAYYDAVNASDPFVELSRIGSDFEFGTDDSRFMEVEFKALLDDIVPYEKLELTATGKVSRKLLTKTEMYSIALDYVCSCAIRLARELFALLPIDTVIVHAVQAQQDARGEEKYTTVLSVKYERAVFEKTNFSAIDASDFTETFLHKLNFLKTQGFREVERITPDMVDIRVAPTEASRSIPQSTKTAKSAKIELPWGWHYQNADYTKPKDDQLCALLQRAKKGTDISDRIKAYRELISAYTSYHEECVQKGAYFEKYFDDTWQHNAGKKYDYLKEWKKELEYLEDSYLDVKEAEDEMQKALPTIKDDLYNIIKLNPGILQKELYSKFHPSIKQLVMDTLYQLVCDGKVVKEKSGNSNKLFIK